MHCFNLIYTTHELVVELIACSIQLYNTAMAVLTVVLLHVKWSSNRGTLEYKRYINVDRVKLKRG